LAAVSVLDPDADSLDFESPDLESLEVESALDSPFLDLPDEPDSLEEPFDDVDSPAGLPCLRA
jgi:hypothetical protein